jgi:hypothetical protein
MAINVQLLVAPLAVTSLVLQPSAAYRQLQQDQPTAETSNSNHAADTATAAAADLASMTAAGAPVDSNPEAAAAATEGSSGSPGDPRGVPGFDFPDRIPGPPDADPSRQGMYKGKYMWVTHCNVVL